MKKLLFAIIFVLSLGITSFAAEPEDLIGTYEGWYYANQGQTGAEFTFYEEDGKVVGVERTFSMPGKSNVPGHLISVEVKVDGDTYIIEEIDWIGEKPSGWFLSNLYVTLEGDVLTGNVNNKSNNTVHLVKNNESYQQVAESVYENHRYEVFDENLTWQEAKDACEAKGGHLVTITSEEEQKYIESLLEEYDDEDFIIGLHRDIDEFGTWVTGESVTYTNWGTPQPDNMTGRQDTAVIVNGRRSGGSYSIDRFQWDDNNNGSYGYICEWETWTESAEWSTPELQKAADNNLIPDVLVGEDMTQPITRGEFAAVSVNLFEAMTGGKAVMSSECNFKDIADDENRNYILKAYNIGAVRGYSDDEYAPDEFLQREQLAAMLCRVYKRSEWPEWTIETDDQYTINYSGVKKFDDDAFISDYAKPSVYFMVKYGILSGVGDNKFAPKNTTPEEEAVGYANATREQAIVMSLRSFENLEIN